MRLVAGHAYNGALSEGLDWAGLVDAASSAMSKKGFIAPKAATVARRGRGLCQSEDHGRDPKRIARPRLERGSRDLDSRTAPVADLLGDALRSNGCSGFPVS